MVELNLSDRQPKRRGQAMVEYALILALLAIAFGFAIAATGPAIGNVFCNVVDNLGGNTASPQGGQCGSTAPDLVNEGGNPPLFWATVTWVAGHRQGETPFPTKIRQPGGSGGGPVSTNTPTPLPTWTAGTNRYADAIPHCQHHARSLADRDGSGLHHSARRPDGQ